MTEEAMAALKQFLVDFTPETPKYSGAGIGKVVEEPTRVEIGEVVGTSECFQKPSPRTCLEEISKLMLRIDRGVELNVTVALGARLKFRKINGIGPDYVVHKATEVYTFNVKIGRQFRDYSKQAQSFVNKSFFAPATLDLPSGANGEYTLHGAEFVVKVGPRYGDAMVASSAFAPNQRLGGKKLWYGTATTTLDFSEARDSLVESAAASLTNLAMLRAAEIRQQLASAGYTGPSFAERSEYIQSNFHERFKVLAEQKLDALVSNGWICTCDAKGQEEGGTLTLQRMKVNNPNAETGSSSDPNVGNGSSHAGSFQVNFEPALFGCKIIGVAPSYTYSGQNYIEIVVSRGDSFAVDVSPVNMTFASGDSETIEQVMSRPPIVTQAVAGKMTTFAFCGTEVTIQLEMKLSDPQPTTPDPANPTNVAPTRTGKMTLTAPSEKMPPVVVVMEED